MGPYLDNIGTKRATILWSPAGFCNFLWHGSHMGSGMARTGPFWDTMGPKLTTMHYGARNGFANDLAWVPRGFIYGATCDLSGTALASQQGNIMGVM